METPSSCTCDDCAVHDGTGACTCVDDSCTCAQCKAEPAEDTEDGKDAEDDAQEDEE